MTIKGFRLAWMVVKDLKAAVKYYTDIVGLTLKEYDEKYHWAELEGSSDGARIGLAQKTDQSEIQPGENAVITLSVDDIDKSKAELAARGAKMVGDILDVPHIVKIQMCEDPDGNKFQIVQSFHGKK